MLTAKQVINKENLSLENFFNLQKDKNPLALKNFCQFIDDYKEAILWNNLFTKHNCDCPEDYSKISLAPKFHEIPFEMQIGIIALWFRTLRYEGENYFEPQWLFENGVSRGSMNYTLGLCFGRLQRILSNPSHKNTAK